MKTNIRNLIALFSFAAFFFWPQLASAETTKSSGFRMSVWTSTESISDSVTSEMKREWVTGGEWTMKTWQCNTAVQSGCIQFNKTSLLHLDHDETVWITKRGTPGKWYYTSVYDSSGKRIIHTDSIKLH